MEEVVVSFKDVGKVFQIPQERHSSLKSLVLSGWRNRGYRKFEAIEKVDSRSTGCEFFGLSAEMAAARARC